MTPQQIQQAEQALCKNDSVLGQVIRRHGTLNHTPRTDYFTSLVRSIVGQQISVKAAAAIFERFKQTTNLDPHIAAELTQQDIKTIGLSSQKSRYISDLAAHFVKDSAVFNHLDSLSDDQVIAELTKIKGVGVWTAQMFLMFTLVRPDVFAPDDAGLQQAIKRLYGLPQVPKRAELMDFAERWKPYRTVACWHLWHALDNEPG